MTRSVLEGVAFGLKDSFMLIQNAGLENIVQIRASGGGTKNALWRQILASTLNSELVTVNTTEGAAFGAALLAGVGAGAWKDVLTACNQTIKITGHTSPDPQSGRGVPKFVSDLQSIVSCAEKQFYSDEPAGWIVKI